jgi:hypothetical protein
MNRRSWLGGSILRCAVLALVVAYHAIAGALAAGSPIPELPPSPPHHGDPPMRILRVTSSDKACEPNCPEWISAEGVITPGSAPALARLVNELGGRRLPVLISSHGGSVRAALEMGVLIRAKRLAVAVARTLVSNCPERASDCPNARGQAISAGAYCASACPLILAAGVERLVGPASLVGVHQITTLMKETEGVEGLTRTVKIYEQGWIDKTVEDYLTQAGVGEPVMTLLRKTPASSIHWLSLDDIKASRLATAALNPAQPILSEGANGLDERAFDATAEPLLLTAMLADRQGSGASLALSYRRGGGALELALTEPAKPGATASNDWTLAGAGGDPLIVKGAGAPAARATLTRIRFCALGREDALVATPTTVTPPASGPAVFNLAASTAVRRIFSEACP